MLCLSRGQLYLPVVKHNEVAVTLLKDEIVCLGLSFLYK